METIAFTISGILRDIMTLTIIILISRTFKWIVRGNLLESNRLDRLQEIAKDNRQIALSSIYTEIFVIIAFICIAFIMDSDGMALVLSSPEKIMSVRTMAATIVALVGVINIILCIVELFKWGFRRLKTDYT